jgi:DNA-binding transcriptional MerR regulator
MTTAAATLGNFSNASFVPSAAGSATVEAARETTIGEMAAEFGVSLRTLRFYEDRRLLRPRREGTMRLYSGVDRLRLQMIIKGKQLGFTLAEIAELIGAQESGDNFEERLQPAQITTQIDHLERQRREIDEAIVRLRATHDRLSSVNRQQVAATS